LAGQLFLVATPIGNLGDITARSAQVLSEVDFIICEDTRHSRVLLDHIGVRKPTVSLPAFAEGERAAPLVSRLENGESAALITDAGSPGISDPGEQLVALAIEAGVTVVPVPGPSAVIAALSASGLPSQRFHFLGFLPRAAQEARTMLEEVAALSATLVLYEAPNRTAATLQVLEDVLGARRACMARELTKLHEEFRRGTLRQLAESTAAQTLKGEVVLLVEGRGAQARWNEDQVKQALSAGLQRGERLKALSVEVAKAAGWAGPEVYKLGLGVK
jgi:16S rRNA (cytidine1402-2'-O)-methyltransferase